MGTGIVYWLMITNCATVAGWIFLGINNLRARKLSFILPCWGMALYFFLNTALTFTSYIVLHKGIDWLTWARFSGAILALVSTAMFAWNANKYNYVPPNYSAN